jgi:hypothetical protein
MTASRADVLARLVDALQPLLDDPDADVVHVEQVDGRVAVRMQQAVRDATTVWCTPGERTVTFEAYLLPAPPANAEEVYRQALVRSSSGWLVYYALDGEGALILRARIEAGRVGPESTSYVLAEIWEQVEVAFGPLARLAFGVREK